MVKKSQENTSQQQQQQQALFAWLEQSITVFILSC